MGIEVILVGFVAFVILNIVYYEFAQPRLRTLRRRFREWMYFEE